MQFPQITPIVNDSPCYHFQCCSSIEALISSTGQPISFEFFNEVVFDKVILHESSSWLLHKIDDGHSEPKLYLEKTTLNFRREFVVAESVEMLLSKIQQIEFGQLAEFQTMRILFGKNKNYFVDISLFDKDKYCVLLTPRRPQAV
jgi:hypothetical protein